MNQYPAYLKGYAVACITFSTSLIVHPVPEIVHALGATVSAGIVLFALGRARGLV